MRVACHDLALGSLREREKLLLGCCDCFDDMFYYRREAAEAAIDEILERTQGANMVRCVDKPVLKQTNRTMRRY